MKIACGTLRHSHLRRAVCCVCRIQPPRGRGAPATTRRMSEPKSQRRQTLLEARRARDETQLRAQVRGPGGGGAFQDGRRRALRMQLQRSFATPDATGGWCKALSAPGEISCGREMRAVCPPAGRARRAAQAARRAGPEGLAARARRARARARGRRARGSAGLSLTLHRRDSLADS